MWCLTGIRSCDTNSGIKKLHAHTLPSSVCCPLGRPGSNDASGAMNTPNASILVFKYDSPLKKPKTLEKLADSRLRQEKNTLSLGYLLVPESKKVLKE